MPESRPVIIFYIQISHWEFMNESSNYAARPESSSSYLLVTEADESYFLPLLAPVIRWHTQTLLSDIAQSIWLLSAKAPLEEAEADKVHSRLDIPDLDLD